MASDEVAIPTKPSDVHAILRAVDPTDHLSVGRAMKAVLVAAHESALNLRHRGNEAATSRAEYKKLAARERRTIRDSQPTGAKWTADDITARVDQSVGNYRYVNEAEPVDLYLLREVAAERLSAARAMNATLREAIEGLKEIAAVAKGTPRERHRQE